MPSETPSEPWWTTFALLWRRAGWPARLLFAAVTAIFVGRAVYEPDGACDLGGFLRIGGALLDGRLLDDPSTNTYPPPFSVAMAPIAALARVVGTRAVRHVWGAGQLAALAYGTVAFARVLRLRLSLGAIALAWTCVWGHVVDDLNNQNVSLLLWALAAWALSRAAAGSTASGGAALAVGATLKIMPGFPLIALLAPGARRRGRLLAGAAAGLAGSAAATWLTLGPGLFRAAAEFWLGRIVSRTGIADASLTARWAAGNRGWSGLALRLSTDGAPATQRASVLLASLLGAVVVAGLAGLFILRPARAFRGVALDALLVTLAGVLALPLVWSHYLTVGLPIALAVCASRGELERRDGAWSTALLASGAVLSCFFNVDLVGRRAWAVVDGYGSTLWGTLLVLAAGLVLRRAWRRRDAVSVEPTSEPVLGVAAPS